MRVQSLVACSLDVLGGGGGTSASASLSEAITLRVRCLPFRSLYSSSSTVGNEGRAETGGGLEDVPRVTILLRFDDRDPGSATIEGGSEGTSGESRSSCSIT